MTSVVHIFGLRVFEVAFSVSFLLLIFAGFCQLVIPSYLLFAVLLVTYRFIRSKGATKLTATGKYVLITGCDTGFGNALARLLDSKGMNVIATCLSENTNGAKHLKETGSDCMNVLQMDVASDDSVAACLHKVQSICGKAGLWAVVNNTGILCTAHAEIQSLSNYKRVAEVNLFGIVRVCKAFLPLIRECKGRVINVTSVQGRLGMFRESAYALTKFGCEGFTDRLRLEMRRFGVKVMIIEPGDYAHSTGLFNAENAKRYARSRQEALDATSKEIKEAYGEDYLDSLPTDINYCCNTDIRPVLEAFDDAILSTKPKSRYLVDGVEWIDPVCMIARCNSILPAFLMDRLYLLTLLPKKSSSKPERK